MWANIHTGMNYAWVFLCGRTACAAPPRQPKDATSFCVSFSGGAGWAFAHDLFVWELAQSLDWQPPLKSLLGAISFNQPLDGD